jgi:hypothetical protein
MMAPKKEVSEMVDNTKMRTADVLLLCWHLGKPAAMDITVTCPLQPRFALGTSRAGSS